jgi:hypothetical protein
MQGELNYFNYFTEIEDVFVRLRAKHVFISPLDWVLIEQWKTKGIPLYIALRGIETAFASHAASNSRRAIKTLVYCQEEVEAQFAEWLDSQVGAAAAADEEAAEAEAPPGKPSTLPFPRETIAEHLTRGLNAISELASSPAANEPSLAEAIDRVLTRFQSINADFNQAVTTNAERLEADLTALEQILHPALMAHLPADEVASARAAAKEQLKPYKANMEKAVYEQTRDGLALKQILAQRNLPRLSLFFI